MDLFSSSRRTFLVTSGLLSGVVNGTVARWRAFSGPQEPSVKNLYERLGVRTRINAKGTYTYLTGSLITPEASRAMEEASQHYVYLVELQQKAGEKIAQMLGVEAAMVTSGAAGAIMLGAAACLTGKDAKKISQLPDLGGMKSEVIIQKTHRNPFDHALRNTGVRLVEVETPEELESAISERTAMMYFLNTAQSKGKIGLEKWVEVGKRRGIPTFNDAAADVPPRSHLSVYNQMGFDLVAFSGGKGLRGPQCAGLLLGRKDLIDAALLNNNPFEDTIGRPCKVGKEEIAGMFAAVERYLEIDHEAEWKEWEQRLDAMEAILTSVPSVKTGRFVPEVANHVPHLYINWDEQKLGISRAQCGKELREGEPSIEVLENDYPQGMAVTPFMMRPDEDLIVAGRIKAILTSGKVNG
jgi:L-seryl-tRNA(Ser) seleniumtransferase